MSIPRFPLAWPAGWPRSGPVGGRRAAQFKVTREKAIRELGNEIARLGGRYPVVSSNVELRIDGQMRMDRGEPVDRGVAVYFERKGKQQVFACDTFTTVKDNIRAIGLTIAALRAVERYGASNMMERALSAFEALPAPKSCWEVLGLAPGAGAGAIQAAYITKAKALHPDAGGPPGAMTELNRARDDALKGAAA